MSLPGYGIWWAWRRGGDIVLLWGTVSLPTAHWRWVTGRQLVQLACSLPSWPGSQSCYSTGSLGILGLFHIAFQRLGCFGFLLYSVFSILLCFSLFYLPLCAPLLLFLSCYLPLSPCFSLFLALSFPFWSASVPPYLGLCLSLPVCMLGSVCLFLPHAWISFSVSVSLCLFPPHCLYFHKHFTSLCDILIIAVHCSCLGKPTNPGFFFIV